MPSRDEADDDDDDDEDDDDDDDDDVWSRDNIRVVMCILFML